MGWCWVASCRNPGQPGPRFPKRRTRSPRLIWLRRPLDEKPTSERSHPARLRAKTCTMLVGLFPLHYALLNPEQSFLCFLRLDSGSMCSSVPNVRIVTCFCNGDVHLHIARATRVSLLQDFQIALR